MVYHETTLTCPKCDTDTKTTGFGINALGGILLETNCKDCGDKITFETNFAGMLSRCQNMEIAWADLSEVKLAEIVVNLRPQ